MWSWCGAVGGLPAPRQGEGNKVEQADAERVGVEEDAIRMAVQAVVGGDVQRDEAGEPAGEAGEVEREQQPAQRADVRRGIGVCCGKRGEVSGDFSR